MTAASGQNPTKNADTCDCGGDSCSCGGHESAECDCESGGEVCSCGGEAANSNVCTTQNHAHTSAHVCSGQSVKLPRRIHAASGLVFGLFLIAHLLLNTSALEGAHFRGTIDFVHGIIHALPGITLVLVFIPLAIQICTGLYLIYKDGLRYKPAGCNRGSTPRFFWQRVTGLVILCFVVLHLGTLHGWSLDPVVRNASGALAGYNPQHLFPAAGWVSGILYLACVWAVIYHLCNGAISGSMVWGLMSHAKAASFKKYSFAGGAVLAVFGALAWIAFDATGMIG